MCRTHENSSLYEEMSCVISVYALPVFCIIGTLMNLLCLLLFLKTSYACNRHRILRSSPFTYYLVALCTFDVVQLILSALIIVPSATLHHFAEHEGLEIKAAITAHSLYYCYPILMASNCASIWTITAIAVQRYFAICRPFAIRKYRILRRNRTVVGIILAASLSLNSIRYWERKISAVNICEPPDNCTTLLYYLDEGPLLTPPIAQAYKLIMDGVIHSLLVFVIPVCLLTVLNIITVIAAYRLRVQNSSQSRERRRVFLVLAIVVVFVLCHTIGIFLRWAEFLSPDFKHNPAESFLSDLSNLLVNVNSALNPLIYLLFTRRFRDLLSEAGGRNRRKGTESTQLTEFAAGEHTPTPRGISRSAERNGLEFFTPRKNARVPQYERIGTSSKPASDV